MISFYTRALSEQTQHSTHDTVRHVTSRLARHVVLVVSWRDATSGIWAHAYIIYYLRAFCERTRPYG